MPPKSITSKSPLISNRTEMDSGEEEMNQGEGGEAKQIELSELKLQLQQQGEMMAKLMKLMGAGTGLPLSTSSEHSSPKQSSTVPIQQSNQVTTMEEPLPRLKGIEPKRLDYAEASKVKILEDWFYDVEQMFIQQKKDGASFNIQLKMIGPYWDREIAQRIQSRMGELATENIPITTWVELQKLIREQFLSSIEEETAYTELLALRMSSKERMDEYVQNGVSIATRISQKRVPQHMKADFLLAGVERTRFPILVATIEKEQRERRKRVTDQGMSVNEMRDRLVELARSEPNEVSKWASMSKGSQGLNPPSKPPGRWHQKTAPSALVQKLNAIGINMEDTSSSSTGYTQQDQQVMFSGDEVRHLLNAVGTETRSKIQCGRCHKFNHTTRDCRAPDTRTCYNCGEIGHIRPNCKKPKKDKSGDAGTEGERSKNE
jgi:hypothetical protein